jgi:hypothetical protein
LHKQVEDFTGIGVLAVGMFEIEVEVFLDIETFVLDLPAQAAALVGQQVDIAGSEAEVGQPLVVQRIDLSLGLWPSFGTFDQVEGMGVVISVGVGQIFRPGLLLNDLAVLAKPNLLMIVRQMGQSGGIAKVHIG